MFEYLNVASLKVQLETVKENGWLIKFIKNPSSQVQLEAVKQNCYSVKFIDNPSLEVLLLAYCTEEAKNKKYLKQYIVEKMEELNR
jgi:hypothetical protein